MSVDIDLSNAGIPGLPNVITIQNAVEESTVREMLKVLQESRDFLDDIANRGGGGGGGRRDPTITTDLINQGLNQSGRVAGSLAGSLGKMAGGVVSVAVAAFRLASILSDLGLKAIDVAKSLSTVNDSMVNAANSLSSVPIVGKFLSKSLGASAESAEKLYGEFTSLSSIGVSFNGSLTTMVNSASNAGLTLDQFNNILKNSGPMLAALGGYADEGAKRFTQISRTLRSKFSPELSKLGLTTEQVNTGMASYINGISHSNSITSKSSAQLAAESAKYLKEIDLLARITGETRESKQKENEQLAKNVQFQAAINHLSSQQQASLRNFVGLFPEASRSFIQDMMATGSITSEATARFNTMMPQFSAAIRAVNRDLGGLSGSSEKQSQLYDTFVLNAKSSFTQYSRLLTHNREFDEQNQAVLAGQKMQIGGLYKGIAAQEQLNAELEEVEKITKFKQEIAEVSNTFLLALKNMGAIETLQTSFIMLADFTRDFLIPMINGMHSAVGMIRAGLIAINPYWEQIKVALTPIADLFIWLYDQTMVLAGGMEGLSKNTTFLFNYFRLSAKVLGLSIQLITWALTPVIKLLKKAADFLEPVFTKLGDGIEYAVDNMDSWVVGLQNFIESIQVWINEKTGGWLGGLTKEEAARRRAQRLAELAEKKAAAEKLKANAQATAAVSNEVKIRTELNNVNSNMLDLSSPEAIARAVAASTASGYSTPGQMLTPNNYTSDMDKFLEALKAPESSGNPNAVNPKSGASGFYQFMPKTWYGVTKRMGKDWPFSDSKDPKKAYAVAVEHYKDEKRIFESTANRPATDTDMHLSWFLGAGKAAKFDKARLENPNQLAVNLHPENLRQNYESYYTQDHRPRTAAEFYQQAQTKIMAGHLKAGHLVNGSPGTPIPTSNTPATIRQPTANTATAVASTARPGAGAPAPAPPPAPAPSPAPAPPPQSSTNELLITLNNKIEKLINVAIGTAQIETDQLRALRTLGDRPILVNK